VITPGEVRQQLATLSNQTLETIAVLKGERQEIDEHAGLDSATAACAYLDFFSDAFRVLASELDRICIEISAGVECDYAAALRQLASRALNDERRCLEFRDEWISTRLPHEQIHQLLDRISFDTYDQLLAYRRLNQIAEKLESAPASGSIDRRALFTRLFRR